MGVSADYVVLIHIVSTCKVLGAMAVVIISHSLLPVQYFTHILWGGEGKNHFRSSVAHREQGRRGSALVSRIDIGIYLLSLGIAATFLLKNLFFLNGWC